MTSGPVRECDVPTIAMPSTSAELLYWDGRLDNRSDLQVALGLGVHVTDTATLLLGVYERWGVSGLGRIIGDWNLVIRDRSRGVMVLACDFAGVRSLYYACRANRLLWASQLDALVARLGVETIDEEYVAAFLTRGGHPSRTPYRGIAVVPAGHAVCIDKAGERRDRIWTPPLGDVIRYDDERRYDEQLRALFREAVAVRLQTPAPVVAELSGGLDSSSVVCMADGLIRGGHAPAACLNTVSYVHPESTDLAFIREVEAFCELRGVHLSTEVTPLVSAADVGRGWPQIWTPVHAAATAVARRLGASVFLTGHNGDLAMGNWLDDSLQVAAPLRHARIGQAMKEALAWSRILRVPMPWILLRALRASLPVGQPLETTYALNALGPRQSGETSLTRVLIERARADAESSLLSTDWQRAVPERRRQYLALSLIQELRTLQRPEPMQTLDYTHPFAHRPLVEFMLSLPPEVVCRPGQPRRLMRRALGGLWPQRLRRRRSKGLFGAPWARALPPLAAGLLRASHWHVVSRGWIDRSSLTSRLHRLLRGIDCNDVQLRQVLVLEYWLRNREQPREPMVSLHTA